MKFVNMAITAAAGSLLLVGSSQAAFLGLVMDLHSTQAVTGSGLSAGFGPSETYRVYASFSEEAYLIAVTDARLERFDPTTGGVMAGGTFFKQKDEFGNHNVWGPTQSQLNSALHGANWAVDTFGTIGSAGGTDNNFQHLSLTTNAGHPAGGGYGGQGHFDGDDNWVSHWGGNWYSGQEEGWVSPMSNQSAQFAVDQGDGTYRVLLWQITVEEGGLFIGHIGGLAFGIGESLFSTTGNFAFMNVPSPGAIALLGLAGLAGVRRRRS